MLDEKKLQRFLGKPETQNCDVTRHAY